MAAVDPDEVQLSGDEPPSAVAATGRPTWKALARLGGRATRRRRSPPRARSSTPARPASCSTPAVVPTPAAPGSRVDVELAAAVAREVPITLAGGLNPGERRPGACSRPRDRRRRRRRARRARASPASGRARTRCGSPCSRKRARDARRHRPNAPFGPTPVHAGLLEVDGAGRWGMERDFGGPLRARDAGRRARAARGRLRRDPPRPAVLGGARRPARPVRRPPDAAVPRGPASPPRSWPQPRPCAAGAAARRRRPRCPGRSACTSSARTSTHTGAHKINNALGQALLTRRLGKSRVIAETGRRPARRRDRHRVRAARPAVRRVHGRGGHPAPGAERAPDARAGRRGPERDQRHRDAQGRGQRGDARLGHQRRDDPLRARQRRWARTRTPRSCATSSAGSATRRRPSWPGVEGRLPDLALACVGGGSNAIGLLARFIGEPSVRLAVAEAAGDGVETGRHAAAIAGGTPGILHGSALADAPGPRRPGRRGAQRVGRPRLPGRSGRSSPRSPRRAGIEVATATDREAVAAMNDDDPRRGHPAGARDVARGRGPAQAPRRARGLRRAPVGRRGRRPARLLGPRRQGHGGARAVRRRRAVGRASGDDRRAARVLPVAARQPREGDLGRRRACRRRHVPGQGQDLPHHRPGRPRRRLDPHDHRPAGRAARHVPGRVPARRRTSAASGGSWPTLDAVDDELLRGIIEGAWRRTAPKAVVKAYDEAAA